MILMKRKLIKTVMAICGMLLVVFVADYLVLRARHQQLGSVTVHRYYTIGLKNGRTEVQYDGDYTYDCVHSLLPHRGDKPCWYLSRKTEEWIDIKTGTPNNPHLF
jgi:hypothetical protein